MIFRNLDDCSQTVSSVKSVDRFVYFIKAVNGVCNEIINLEFTDDHFVDELWDILSGLPSTESSALPASASHQLEWSGLDFLTSCCDTNDTAFSEASVSGLKSSSHHCDIACAVVSEVDAPLLF